METSAAAAAHAALRRILDPELGVNIVDLGLVYAVECAPGAVRVRLTMTSPSCPLGEQVAEEVEAVLRDAFPAAEVSVELVWEPAWRPDMMTEEGRRQLGFPA